MADAKVWFIGPESEVYHLIRDCPRLNGSRRYWPISHDTLENLLRVDPHRRLCMWCERDEEGT